VELVIIFILTIIGFPVVTFTEGPPRIILGILFLLIFPGYTLLAALFPKKNNMKGIEWLAFTFVLSFALVSFTGLVLNYTMWGIELTPIYVGIAIIVIITSGIALLRRSRLSEAERFSLKINFKMPKWGNVSTFNKVLSVILAIVVIGAGFTLFYVTKNQKTPEAFSSFYILGTDNLIKDYPKQVTLRDPKDVILGIENHEHQQSSYNITVTIGGTKTQEIGPIVLSSGEKWTDKVTLNPLVAGNGQKVEFLLNKGEEPVPYLVLHLWLDVKK